MNPGADPGFEISAEVREAGVETSPNLAICSNCIFFLPQKPQFNFQFLFRRNFPLESTGVLLERRFVLLKFSLPISSPSVS